MVGEIRRLGKKILKRRPLDLLHLAVRAIAGIEIVLEKRTEIDLLERIFLLDRGDGIFFGGGRGGALAVFFFLADFVEQRNRFFQLFENRILDHLSRDHVLELKLVEREHRDHLHKPRRKDLPLRELDAEFVLKKNHKSCRWSFVVGRSSFAAHRRYRLLNLPRPTTDDQRRFLL